jgi:hypothetical protein
MVPLLAVAVSCIILVFPLVVPANVAFGAVMPRWKRRYP